MGLSRRMKEEYNQSIRVSRDVKGRKMNFSSSETDFVKDNEAYVPVADSDKRRIGSIEEMDRLLAFREDVVPFLSFQVILSKSVF